MTFFVPGPPKGKARPRSIIGRDGKIHVYTDKKSLEYEKLIQECLMTVPEPIIPSEGYFSMRIEVIYPIPVSTPKSKREEMLLGLIRPAKKPDLDNIAKAVCDALNNHVYFDDKQVVNLSIWKVYGDKPGLQVTIAKI